MASTEKYDPLIFENLDLDANIDKNMTVVSIKADGRAWAYKEGKNYWYLIDISVLRFFGIDPIVASVNNASVTYLLDIDKLNKPN